MRVHPPVVAGTFYPAEPDLLRAKLDAMAARAPAAGGASPKVVVLPHAGYRFSGDVAAAGLVGVKDIKRVVILGPSHRHAFRGIALPDAEALATPLGAVPLDKAAVAALLEEPEASVVPEAFASEHSVEVMLPFLQQAFGSMSIVPLVVGEIAPKRLAQIIETQWGGPETLIVVSTDLTHFLTAEAAEATDLKTAYAIEQLSPEGLGPDAACGHRPLTAVLHIAARRGMRMTRRALTHSGAVTEDRSRVVGYGAWVGHDAEEAALSSVHRASALRIARQTLTSRVRRGTMPAIDLASFAMPLRSVAPAFVTLNKEGRLRGCIGSLKAHRPLAEDILQNTVKAGFHDPRFEPVTVSEIDALTIEIAILSMPTPMTFADEHDLLGQLRPGRDGLILQSAGRRGTFLPKVWDALSTSEAFLNGLKVKAGLPRDHWSGDLQLWRYTAETFRE